MTMLVWLNYCATRAMTPSIPSAPRAKHTHTRILFTESNSNLYFSLFTSAVINGFFGVLLGVSESSLIDSVGAARLKFPGTLLPTCRDSKLFKLRINQKHKIKKGKGNRTKQQNPYVHQKYVC